MRCCLLQLHSIGSRQVDQCAVQKGIMFQDVTTLLLDPEAFQFSIDDLTQRYKHQNIDAVVGESCRPGA